MGFGGAHVLIEENTRYAYSPNAALLGTYNVNETTHLTVMARYVNLAIPTAPQGASANYVNIAGVSFGLKKDIRPTFQSCLKLEFSTMMAELQEQEKVVPDFNTD